MFLWEVYSSGSRDIFLFNLLFVFYGLSSIGLIFSVLKLFKQNVSVSRLLLGILIYFVGSFLITDLLMGLIFEYGNKIRSAPAGMLLILIAVSISISVMFVIIQKWVFRQKDITKALFAFLIAQPVLAILFFVILIFSGI
jgi:hypothetical protein